MNEIRQTMRTKAKPPHNGAVTHHHDQVITLQSFNTRKTIKSKPKPQIPELLPFSFIIHHLNVIKQRKCENR